MTIVEDIVDHALVGIQRKPEHKECLDSNIAIKPVVTRDRTTLIVRVEKEPALVAEEREVAIYSLVNKSAWRRTQRESGKYKALSRAWDLLDENRGALRVSGQYGDVEWTYILTLRNGSEDHERFLDSDTRFA